MMRSPTKRSASSTRPAVADPPVLRRLLVLLFVVADAALVVVFVAAYAARSMSAYLFWWTELVAVFFPYLTLLVLAATFVAGALRQKKRLVLHLALLVLAALRFLPPERPVAADGAEVLTVMTYNVPRWWDGLNDEARGEAMVELVQAETPHLLSFQEAVLFTSAADRDQNARTAAAVVEALPYRFALPRVEGTNGTTRRTDIPVLGRVPMERATLTTLRMDTADDEGTEVIRVPFVWEGREAVLYNLHLRSYGSAKPWKADEPRLFDPTFWARYLRQYREAYRVRAWEAEEIHRILAAETRPFIVTGDFNSTPHNWVYGRLKGDLGLRDAFKVGGRGWGATYHADLPFARIDYVLVSPAWAVVSAHVPEASLSDHRPVVARLRWRDPEPGVPPARP